MNKIFIKTLIDIGPFRLLKRIIYKIREKLDRSFYFLYKVDFKIRKKENPIFRDYLFKEKRDLQLQKKNLYNIKKVKFEFINDIKTLPIPIVEWNNKKWSRLWCFNLHYFEYIEFRHRSVRFINYLIKLNNFYI